MMTRHRGHSRTPGVGLPTDGPWPELEALGFVRREPVSGDDLAALVVDRWFIGHAPSTNPPSL